MARSMRRFENELARDGLLLIKLAKTGEITKHLAGPGTPIWNQWPDTRLEALYEVAFLRMFITWETFLEDTFYRYMCGHESITYGQAIPVGRYFGKIQLAEAAVLGRSPYVSWYDPQRVITRCRTHISRGRHEAVFSANAVWLDHLSRIRHRIAHGQQDARRRFDRATVALSGRAYPASRPGRFLRTWNIGTFPQVRWLESLIDQMGQLANQIV